MIRSVMFGVGVGVGVGVFVSVHCFVCMHYVRGWSVAYSNQAFHDQGPRSGSQRFKRSEAIVRETACIQSIH